MGSRHTKVSIKLLPTGGIIKLTATAMQASELPRKIICCQQRLVLVAATQASEPLKELKTCDLNKASTTTKTLLREII